MLYARHPVSTFFLVLKTCCSCDTLCFSKDIVLDQKLKTIQVLQNCSEVGTSRHSKKSRHFGWQKIIDSLKFSRKYSPENCLSEFVFNINRLPMWRKDPKCLQLFCGLSCTSRNSTLWATLMSFGVNAKLVRILQAMYQNAKAMDNLASQGLYTSADYGKV